MKVCSKCNQEKHESDFCKRNDRKSGLTSWCKNCMKTDYWDSPKQDRRKSRYERDKEYFAKSPEKYILIRIRYSAKARGLDFNLTIEDIIIPEKCPILGVKLNRAGHNLKDMYTPSLDRIDNSKGYIKGNVMVISRKANTMKNSATKEELIAFSKYFLKIFDT